MKCLFRMVLMLSGVCLQNGTCFADDKSDLDDSFGLAEKLKDEGKFKEAIRHYEYALALSLKVHGEDDVSTGLILHKLGDNYHRMQDFAKAEHMYKGSIKIFEAAVGKDHVALGTLLADLANLYQQQDFYAKALPLRVRVLAIREANLDKNHRDVKRAIYKLAHTYMGLGLHASAEPLLIRSLTISEVLDGKDHPIVVYALNDLAKAYYSQGKYALAEQHYRRSLTILDAGKDDLAPERNPNVATTLAGLASIRIELGQSAQAEPLLLRSLKIQETAYGPGKSQVADALNNLAIFYSGQRKYAQAEPLCLRSLKIREEFYGKDHPDVAQSLNNLGIIYQGQGLFDRAEPLFERSLKIRETFFGQDHPSVARTLTSLADLHFTQKRYARAEPLYIRSLSIRERAHGKNHPEVLVSLDCVVGLLMETFKFTEAVAIQHRVQQGTRTFLLRELQSLSAREQQVYLDQSANWGFARALSLGRYVRNDQAGVMRGAEWLLNGKAIGLEAQSLNSLLERQASATDLRQLSELRAQEAALALRDSKSQEIDGLQARRRALEKQIASTGGAANKLAQPWIELPAVRRMIPQDGLLIEIAHFRPYRVRPKADEQRWDEAHYVAWVIPPAGDIAVVDLGEAEAIDDAVKEVRATVAKSAKRLKEVGEPKAAAEMAESLQKLADLVLTPLTPHLAQAKSLILSPDGELWLAPWAALPVGKGRFLVEDYALRYVITGRDLVATPAAKKLATSAPLVLADPRFDDGAGDAAAAEDGGRGTLSRLPQVGRLPGTASEAEAILPRLATLTGAAPTVHTDEKATEAAVKAAVRPKVLILATHGFFLPTQEVVVPDDRLAGEGRRSAASLTKDGQPVENPLLRCGLLLAGCNRRGAIEAGEDDGILTGLEIVGTDLRGTEMVVLSACETGLGDVKTGEGVAGLRQAFQLAGAESVVATLWQIPDAQSAQLMVGFFDHLTKKLPRDEALRASQLEQIKARRDRFGAAHPFFWAAYTVTGQVK